MKYMLTILALVFTCGAFAQNATTTTFESQVNMKPWSDNVAVFTNGRVKSFETFARSFMPYIIGPRTFESQELTFTYFDLLIRPERYLGEPIIYVKHKGLRAAIIGELNTQDPAVKERADSFMKTGLVLSLIHI